MSAFKAYDIRGIWGKEIDEELCYRVGYFLPSLLSARSVVVGRDIRLSSETAHDALVRGITDSGADVWDLGLSTTPMITFALVRLDADASVQITASHNPPEYNGLKINRRGGLPVGGDSGLKELERLTKEGTVKVAQEKGKILDKGAIREEYVAYMRQYADGIRNLDITVDCSYGMANLVIKDILRGSVHYICDHYDGSFPTHEPNPLDERNCRELEKATVENGSDIGVIYDGDADRVVFVDEKGRFVQPDYITAVLGLYYKEHGETGAVVQDIRTSKSATEYLERLGFKVTTWKVGHAYAKPKLRELDAIFGGELAGHYYFRDFFFCDSGILASLFVLSVASRLKEEGRTFSSLIDSIVSYANSGEVNFRLERKDDAINALYEEFVTNGDPITIMDFDGYRIEYGSWWFNVRKSNTEPYLRIVAEARTKEELDEKMGRIRKIIESFS